MDPTPKQKSKKKTKKETLWEHDNRKPLLKMLFEMVQNSNNKMNTQYNTLLPIHLQPYTTFSLHLSFHMCVTAIQSIWHDSNF